MFLKVKSSLQVARDLCKGGATTVNDRIISIEMEFSIRDVSIKCVHINAKEDWAQNRALFNTVEELPSKCIP